MKRRLSPNPNRRDFLKACFATTAGSLVLGGGAHHTWNRFNHEVATDAARRAKRDGLYPYRDVESLQEHFEQRFRPTGTTKLIFYACGAWIGLESYLKGRQDAEEHRPDIY